MIPGIHKACYTCKYPNPNEDRWTGTHWAIGCDAPNQEGKKIGWWFAKDEEGNEIIRACPCWAPKEEKIIEHEDCLPGQINIYDWLGGTE